MERADDRSRIAEKSRMRWKPHVRFWGRAGGGDSNDEVVGAWLAN
jgi:hypothetical protein